eukprot:320300_1
MMDWYPSICSQQNYLNRQLFRNNLPMRFDNLIVTNLNTLTTKNLQRLIDVEGSDLILNKCRFDNITGINNEPYFIRAGTVKMYNTTFSNILYTTEPCDDNGAFILLQTYAADEIDLSFYMQDCSVMNYNAMSFIEFNTNNYHSSVRSINIYNSSFIN